MPKLSKREQAKREKKAASSISTAPLPTSTPEPETPAAAEEKAQASLPHDVCEEDEDDRPRYVSQPETEEQAAARVAAYAAQGRDPWGVLLEPAVCAHDGCQYCKRKVVQELPYTDEECQELVKELDEDGARAPLAVGVDLDEVVARVTPDVREQTTREVRLS
jgi:hypothetical protein